MVNKWQDEAVGITSLAGIHLPKISLLTLSLYLFTKRNTPTRHNCYLTVVFNTCGLENLETESC